MKDILIRNAIIVDGTGKAPFAADMLIERDKIRDIGHFPDADARQVIDATGLHLTPGFIDCHTHSELNLMYNRQQPNAVYAGISTMVTGLCGLGFAPIRPEHFDSAIQMNAGIFEDKRAFYPRWSTFAEYLACLDGCAVNVASCVPHNAIRQVAAGFSSEPLCGETLKAAEEALDTALAQGCVGFSVGLSYYPGAYADTEELVALCRVARRHDAVFCVHARLNDIGSSFDPLAEIAEVVDRTGVRLHMLHYATSPVNHLGNPMAIIAPFDEITKRGAKVTFEYYPYLTGAGFLLVFLPGWAQEGGYEAIMERLSLPSLRDRLLEGIAERYRLIVRNGIKTVIAATKDPYSEHINRTVEVIACERGVSVAEAIRMLLIENQLEVGIHNTEPDDEEIRVRLFEDQFELLSHDGYTIGSDTIPTGEYCHPRLAGTYPRILCQMRRRGVPLERTIRKITALPAEIYRLKNRGTLAPGQQADICLLDYDAVTDTATFDAPRRRPTGIETLIVNGKPVMENGGITGLLTGSAIGIQRRPDLRD